MKISRRRSSGRGGFTLIEVLVAAGVSLLVIAGLLGAGVRFQALAVQHQQKMVAQQSLRAAADLISLEIEKAGAGIGTARLNLGGALTQGTILPVTADPFLLDTTFASPTGDYLNFPSDSLTLFSGNTASVVSLSCCPGVENLGVCGSCNVKNATGFCTSVTAPSTYTANSNIVYVNPTLGVACGQTITSLPILNQLVSIPGWNSLGIPSAADPCNPSSTLWCNTGTFALQLNASTMRVNWKPTVAGGAQRPRLQMDPDGPFGPLPYTDLLWDVERMQVRVAIADLTQPGVFNFYPDVTAGRPALDKCTTSSCPIIGGLDTKDISLAAGLSALDGLKTQLQRRIRSIEVTLVSRTATADLSKVKKVAGVFALDSNGFPQDGYTRRQQVFQVSPRNFPITEANQ